MATETAKATKKNGKRAPPKEGDKPKKALTAFFLYSAEERPKLKDDEQYMSENKDGKLVTDIGKLGKELGRRWRTLDEAKKAKWTDLAAEMKTQYEVNVKKWEEKYPEEAKKEKEAMEKKKAKAAEKRKEAAAERKKEKKEAAAEKKKDKKKDKKKRKRAAKEESEESEEDDD